MTEQVKEHWAKNEAHRKRFWVEAHNLGYTNEQVHEELDVESIYDWTGTGKEALDFLKFLRKTEKDAQTAAEQKA